MVYALKTPANSSLPRGTNARTASAPPPAASAASDDTEGAYKCILEVNVCENMVVATTEDTAPPMFCAKMRKASERGTCDGGSAYWTAIMAC